MHLLTSEPRPDDALTIAGPGTQSPRGTRLLSDPRRLTMPATRIGETSTRAVTLTNRSARPVEIIDITPQARPAAFVSSAIDSTLIEPGASTRAHVAFSPLAAHAHRDTLVVETERGPDVGVAVVGRGKASLADGVAGHDPAAEHDDEDARRDQREAAARQDAHAGEAPLVFTYDQLDAAFTQAVDFGARGMYPEALVLATAVAERMRELSAPQHIAEVLDRLALGRHAASFEVAMAHDIAIDVERRARSGWTIARDTSLGAFRQGRTTIRLMTGESHDAAELRGFDRHTLALGAVTAVPAVAALLPYLAAELPVLAPLLWEEVSILAYAARGVFATVTSWIATHPDEALAWAEVAVGLGIDAGEDPEGFYDGLQTTEGWFRIATTLFFSVLPVRGSRAHGDDEASGPLGGPSRGGHAADAPEPTSRAPARAGSLGTPEQVQRATVVTVDRLQAFATAVRTRADHAIGTPARRSSTAGASEDVHSPHAGTDHDGRDPAGPRRRILEPFAGDKLDSARDLARQHPGAQVVAAEARFPPTAADIARFRAEGGEFLAERFAESLPPGSVEKIYVRYPIPHAKGLENANAGMRDAILAELSRNPGMNRAEAMVRAVQVRHGEIESMTNLGPHAIEKLTMGGTIEVVYWEREIAGEVRALMGRDYIDPASGQRFSIEISSPPEPIARASLPNSGLGIPDEVEVVTRMTIRKVATP